MTVQTFTPLKNICPQDMIPDDGIKATQEELLQQENINKNYGKAILMQVR